MSMEKRSSELWVWESLSPADRTELRITSAAFDPTIQAALRMLIAFPVFTDEAVTDTIKDVLEAKILPRYNIPPECSKDVFDMAERIIQEEMN